MADGAAVDVTVAMDRGTGNAMDVKFPTTDNRTTVAANAATTAARTAGLGRPRITLHTRIPSTAKILRAAR